VCGKLLKAGRGDTLEYSEESQKASSPVNHLSSDWLCDLLRSLDPRPSTTRLLVVSLGFLQCWYAEQRRVTSQRQNGQETAPI